MIIIQIIALGHFSIPVYFWAFMSGIQTPTSFVVWKKGFIVVALLEGTVYSRSEVIHLFWDCGNGLIITIFGEFLFEDSFVPVVFVVVSWIFLLVLGIGWNLVIESDLGLWKEFYESILGVFVPVYGVVVIIFYLFFEKVLVHKFNIVGK